MNPNKAFKDKKRSWKYNFTSPTAYLRIKCDMCGHVIEVSRSLWQSDQEIVCPDCEATDYWEIHR